MIAQKEPLPLDRGLGIYSVAVSPIGKGDERGLFF